MNGLIILYGESYKRYYEDKSDKFFRRLDYNNSNFKLLSNKSEIDIIFTTKSHEYNKKLIEDIKPKYYDFENNLENLFNNIKNKLNSYKFIIISKFNFKINYKLIFNTLNNSNSFYSKNGLFFINNENLNYLEINKNTINLKDNNLIDNNDNKIIFFEEIVDNNIIIEDLFGLLLLNRNPKIIYNFVRIKKTAHYLYLVGNTKPYEKYLTIENKDSHSLKIYTNLINTFNFNEKIIIKGKIKMNRLIIFDGLHRSCILLKNNFKTIKILRVEKFPLIDKTKQYVLNKIIH